MPGKYIRVSSKLHQLVKIRSNERHVSMKFFVELCLWDRLKKDEEDQKSVKSKRRNK